MRVRVRFDKINFIVRRESQIDPRIAVDREQPVNVFARLLDLRDQRRLEIFRKLAIQSPALPIFLVPLRFIGRDLRFVRPHFAEDQLADRENGQSRIAHQTHIQLAAVDVLLRDRVRVMFLVDERDPFAELFLVLDERGLRNSVGRFVFYRLH